MRLFFYQIKLFIKQNKLLVLYVYVENCKYIILDLSKLYENN
jgi:hypothetical protein